MKNERIDHKIADFGLRIGGLAIVIDNGFYGHLYADGHPIGDVGKVVRVERVVQPGEIIKLDIGGFIIGHKRKVTILVRSYERRDLIHVDGDQTTELRPMALMEPGQLLKISEYEASNEDCNIYNRKL